MKVSGKSLELRRKAQDERLVQSGGAPTAPRRMPADEPMGEEQLVEMVRPLVPPRHERPRCHGQDGTAEV